MSRELLQYRPKAGDDVSFVVYCGPRENNKFPKRLQITIFGTHATAFTTLSGEQAQELVKILQKEFP